LFLITCGIAILSVQSQRAQQHAEAARREALGSDEDEEELQRTRAFDDFKDTHPRGFGNSKLRPCGWSIGPSGL